MNTQKQIVLIVSLMFIFVGGCAAYAAIDLPVRSEDQIEWTNDQSLERGALLFANNCRTCHGNKGEGGVGFPLNTEAFKDQDPLVLASNRALIRRTLYCGRANTLMPAWLNTNGGALNSVQIEHLVNLLTAPADTEVDGVPTSEWWLEAEHFAQTLNHEISVLVGGDTLGTIAKGHGIGYAEISAANGNISIDQLLESGSKVNMPGFALEPDGYVYNVYKDNETLRKIADAHFVGAIVLADLNGLKYKFAEKRGVATFSLVAEDGSPLAGLFPGSEMKLPEGATYTVKAEDTVEAIAAAHSISASELRSLNGDRITVEADDEAIPHVRQLALPADVYIAAEGDTLEAIAEAHGLTDVAALATANNLDPAAPVINPGQRIELPADSVYMVAAVDSWASVAAAHDTSAAELAAANNADAAVPLSPDVVLTLPKIDAYIVAGQDLEAVAKGYSNVTAETLAEANNVAADAVIAVGTTLVLPETAWGTAPPDAKNTGTACVQYAVSAADWEKIVGPSATPAPITEPEEFTTDLVIEAHAADWTVVSDGETQPANLGVAKVAVGTPVTFTSIVGLHNIVFNGEVQGDDLRQGDTREIVFDTPGQYTITCDYHPPMLATVFVAEQ